MVEQHLTAEGAAGGQVEAFGESLELRDGLLAPARAAENGDRPLRLGKQSFQLFQLPGTRMAFHRLIGFRRHRLRLLRQHVFRQGQDHRAGAAGCRDRKGAGDEFRDAGGIVDLAHPFGDFGEGAAIFDFLEGFAFTRIALHLADEQDHRDRILAGDMQAGGCVHGARTARHHADAGFAGEPAPGIGHHRGAAFLAADHDIDIGIVERVENGEIAFSRHAGHPPDAVCLQRLNDQFSACFHVCSSQSTSLKACQMAGDTGAILAVLFTRRSRQMM